MRVLAAPGAFKESLDAASAAGAIASGVAAAVSRARVDVCPLADGGDGTLDAVIARANGRRHTVSVTGPLGEPIEACIALLGDGTALIESALACGLALIPRERRDPRRATTRGVGELIVAAIAAGATRVVVGLGGTATVDGGAGALAGLGFVCLDARGRPIEVAGGAGLGAVGRIIAPEHRPWERIPIVLAHDVDNPLLGADGAARTYGPQKGATPDDVEALEAGLTRWAVCLRAAFGVDAAPRRGAGAAGGLGAGLLGALAGELVSGADWVMNAVDFDARVREVDLVVTGEGALDATSTRGKIVSQVAARAGAIPVVALAGELRPGWESLLDRGLTAAFAVAPGPSTALESRAHTARNLARTAGQVARLIRVAPPA